MISLSDSQLSFVIAVTTPLLPPDRSAFLKELAARLEREPMIGDGSLNRICRTVLADGRYFRPPVSAVTEPRPRERAKTGAPIA